MPPHLKGENSLRETLSLEEIVYFVKIAVDWGVNKVKITGGEPLLRPNILELVKKLSQIRGIHELSMTTNGVLLSKYAKELKRNGLKRVNISLDTLKREKFVKITRRAYFEEVIKGIKAAKQAHLEPVKINVVVLKGVNDDEINDFAKLTLEEPLSVRFIEHLPSLNNHFYFPNKKVKKKIERRFGELEENKIKNGRGEIKFISARSEPFCSSCDRIRLTAQGTLRACLLSNFELPLREIIQKRNSQRLKERLDRATNYKLWRRQKVNFTPQLHQMFRIGG
jgi:cyclic pyranopterin phosphate synthase